MANVCITQVMLNTVSQVIAHERTGSVRHLARDAFRLHRRGNRFDWQGREICIWAIFIDWLIDRLVAAIIWNAEIINIDRNTFWRDCDTATGLTNSDNEIWLVRFNRCDNRINGFITRDRHVANDDFSTIYKGAPEQAL